MWFLTNLERLNKERDEVAKLQESVNWIESAEWRFNDSKLAIFVNLFIDDKVVGLKLIYPAYYPANPPTVYPAVKERLSSEHQYGRDGELCLEWGADNWYEDLTAGDMIISAYKLLALENVNSDEISAADIPSRHKLELGQEVRTKYSRFLCHNKFIESFLDKLHFNQSYNAKFIYIQIDNSSPIILNEVKLTDDETMLDSMIPEYITKKTFAIDGYIIKTNYANQFFEVNPASEVIELASLIMPFIEDFDEWVNILFISDSNDIFLFQKVTNKSGWHVPPNIYIENTNLLRLGEGYSNLSKKKVGVVGLGSAGSKVAISLCRSGVKDFYLVDHDVFLPENLCRHSLDWRDIGQHKVDAVSNALSLIDSEVKVETRRVKLSGQESTASVDGILTKLGNCDLIIDATADARTFNQLSSVSVQCRKPLFWLEIFAGGFGGYIARSLPGIDSSPKQMRAEIKIFLDRKGFPNFKSPEVYASIDEKGIIMRADDSDVAIISSNMSKMIIDYLLNNCISSFPHSLYFIGMRKEWIFEQALHVIPFTFNDYSEKETEILSVEKKNQNIEFISNLLDKTE